MTTILHALAGIWSLLAVSQLVAFYALLSAKGVSGTIPYSTLLAIGAIAFVASTTIAWLLVVKKQKKLAITLSAVMCFYFPFGTIFGVITILVLRNPCLQLFFGTSPAVQVRMPEASRDRSLRT